jgi:excisionase family DNA binding protein
LPDAQGCRIQLGRRGRSEKLREKEKRFAGVFRARVTTAVSRGWGKENPMPNPSNPFCSLNHPVTQPSVRPAGAAATTAATNPTGEVGAVPPEGSPVFHTVEEVARVLRVSTKTVDRRIKAGGIIKVPMGGRLVRISSAELQRLAANAPLKPAVARDAVSIT